MDDPWAQRLLAGAQVEDDRVEDDAGGEDNPGLEAAAWPIVAVPLNVEGIQEYVGNEQLGGDARNASLA